MKVAIIHYWFITRRGGEKVVESILKLFPQADIYTLFYDKKTYGNYISKHKVYSSILDKPILRKHYHKLFPFYPLAVKSLKLKKDYDLVISSESGPAKGVKINNNTPHVCYIHSPMRYVWSHQEMYLHSISKILHPFARFFLKRLKKWDQSTIDNVDLYIANSENVAKRVKKFYNKDSIVIHPPVEEELLKKPIKENPKQVYLSLGAITPYKKIDLLIEAFNQNKKELIIIGEGSEKSKLKRKANSNIQFKSFPNWKDVEKIINQSKALLFPGEEDFGITPLEIMAYGVPVIAYKKGGALETVIENKKNIAKSTGVFFEKQTPKSLNKAIIFFEKHQAMFHQDFIRSHAKTFGETTFLDKFDQAIKNYFLTLVSN